VFDLFLRKEPKVFVGIDIGSDAIRALSLSKTTSGFQIENFNVQSLPDQAVQQGEVKDRDAVLAALQKIRAVIGVTDIAVAVPGSSVISKVISLDQNLSEREIEAQIWLEASKIFPQKSENMSLDFFKLNNNAGTDKKINVMLVAARAESVDLRCAILSEAGFNVRVVDVDHFALANACQYFLSKDDKILPQSTTAIFNFRHPVVSLIILRDGMVVYTREVMLESGGELPLQELSEELLVTEKANEQPQELSNETSTEEKPNEEIIESFDASSLAEKTSEKSTELTDELPLAEKASEESTELTDELSLEEKTSEEPEEPPKQASTNSKFSGLVTQMRRALQFFYSASESHGLDRIVLTGDVKDIKQDEFINQIKETMNLDVLFANPFKNISMSKFVDQKLLDEVAASMMISFGLTLRGFDDVTH
jgi:type IV pilus assembly protein PilM